MPAAAIDDSLEDGSGEPETGPLRRCAVSRERLPKDRMIRFVLSPDRAVVPDIGARLPGRGIWLSAKRDVIHTACTKGAFARAARGVVSVPPDLLSGLIAALERRIGDHLGLARRAGQAVSGFEKTREWHRSGQAAVIVQAADGSAEERERCVGANTSGVPVIAPLPADRLGAIFGRERAVHVAIAAGALADRLVADAARLAGLAVATGSDVARPDRKDAAAAGARREKQAPGATPAGRNEWDQTSL